MFDAVLIENLGKPTVTVIQDRFRSAALAHAKILGLPDVAFVVEPAPVSGNLQHDVDKLVADNWDRIMSALTDAGGGAPVNRAGAPAKAVRSSRVDIDDYEKWEDMVEANDWSDGLPVAPPMSKKVDAILAYLKRDPAEMLGVIPPANGVATVEQVAIQCAMAGCKPEYVPIVLAALDAILDPTFNLHGVQSTTHPLGPLVIVSGPITKELPFNVGNGAFGGGGHANVSIGRAVRLIMWNLGGGKPHTYDMSPLGGSHKFTFCVAENRDKSPYDSIHTEFGFKQDDNAVTVFGCAAPYPAVVNGTARRMLNTICEGFSSTTIPMYHGAGQALFVLSIKPVMVLAQAGYSKADIRQYIFDHARLSKRHLKEWGALEDLHDYAQVYWGEPGLASERINMEHAPDDTKLPMFRSVDDIRVIVTGGDTQWWGAFLPGWGNYGGFFLSRPIVLPK